MGGGSNLSLVLPAGMSTTPVKSNAAAAAAAAASEGEEGEGEGGDAALNGSLHGAAKDPQAADDLIKASSPTCVLSDRSRMLAVPFVALGLGIGLGLGLGLAAVLSVAWGIKVEACLQSERIWGMRVGRERWCGLSVGCHPLE